MAVVSAPLTLVCGAHGLRDFRVRKALVVAQYAGITLELDKSPKYEKFQCLETSEGSLVEPNAILRYLARCCPDRDLDGTSLRERALVEQWLDFSALEVEPAVVNEVDLSPAMTVLNGHLLHHTYLVGNQITLADISLASALVAIDNKEIPQSVTRWFQMCINQPEFIAIDAPASSVTESLSEAAPIELRECQLKNVDDKTQEGIIDKARKACDTNSTDPKKKKKKQSVKGAKKKSVSKKGKSSKKNSSKKEPKAKKHAHKKTKS